MRNPFVTVNRRGLELEALSVEDRLHKVRKFDLEQCADALEMPDLQQTVRQALWRRVRQLLREETGDA